MKNVYSLVSALLVLIMSSAFSIALSMESDPTIRVKKIPLSQVLEKKLLTTKIGNISTTKGIYDLTDVFYNLGADFPEGTSVTLNPKIKRLIVTNSASQIDLITDMLKINFVK